MVGKATPDRGGPQKNPDGVDPNIKRTRKTQPDGHNSGVKIWSLCSVSQHPLTCKPWTTLSNPCNKVRGKYDCKEVFLRRFFLRPSSLHLLSLRRYVPSIYMYISAWIRRWLYNNSSKKTRECTREQLAGIGAVKRKANALKINCVTLTNYVIWASYQDVNRE